LSARDTFAFLDEKIAYDLDHWRQAGSVLPHNTYLFLHLLFIINIVHGVHDRLEQKRLN